MDQTLRSTSSRKRLRTEVMQMQHNSCYEVEIASMNDQPTVVNGYNNNCNPLKTYGCRGSRRFLPIPASHHVFHSEDWKPQGETMFIPTQTDALINLQNIEQITVTKGTFFLCDENSRFKRSAEGIALELWRYDDQIRRLYISRSFVFTSPQMKVLIAIITIWTLFEHAQLDDHLTADDFRFCIHNCALCVQMYGCHYNGKQCADSCVQSAGQSIDRYCKNKKYFHSNGED